MKLRSVELALPGAKQAAEFICAQWGGKLAAQINSTYYVRGTGSFPYLVAFSERAHKCVESVTFVATEDEIGAIKLRAADAGVAYANVQCEDLGGGEGIVLSGPDGEVLRFIANAETVEELDDIDLPRQLTHVVFNATDAERSADFVESILNFRVSDRTKGMVFVRCNNAHHSTAFARAGFASLNHIAFEMIDLDAVMRGIGRMRDQGFSPSWGPGRHGPGDNAFAYYIAPFGAVIEFSTAVEHVDDDYIPGEPADWTWPEGRIDQWGISDKDFVGLNAAEQTFTFDLSLYNQLLRRS